MIKLNFAKYKDKVKACWLGKNIGGTMGTPYEGTKEYLDIQGFVTKKGEVLPNDDLDLQLVWLLALERSGAENITASLLGEYWRTFITPHWNEYGIGKANMMAGLCPPLSGDYENSWRDSNGAWIRTEIWACSVPGNPEAACRYAVEDAKVDHGAGEGTYAAAFVAAMQSAAFVLDDIRKCIDVGLACIPETSRVAKSVRFAVESYDKGMQQREMRDAIQQMNADIGDGWFEAPSNVAYVILGLLYGQGDFKKSMIAAINCGDDTDCTGATLGATLGILYGMKGIPEDWIEYLGDDIVTISIAKGTTARSCPATCTELTERVVRVAPAALFANHKHAYNACGDITLTELEEDSIPEDIENLLMTGAANAKRRLSTLKPYMLEFSHPLYRVELTLNKAPEMAPFSELGVHLNIIHAVNEHDNVPFVISARWLLPEGFTVEGGKRTIHVHDWTRHTEYPHEETDYVIKAGEKVEAISRAVLELSIPGRHTVLYCPVTILA